jgi:small subunit ribosomal protein S1
MMFCLLLSLFSTASSFWNFQTLLKYGRNDQLNMVSTVTGKQKQLIKLKERYTGRYDLTSVTEDADDAITSYDFFAQADEEEVDPPKAGQTITGSVIEMDDNGALIEIGGKMSGYIPLKEVSLRTLKHVNEVLEIGQEVTGEVLGTLKGMPVVSLRTAQLITAWDEILKVRAADTSFETEILEVNKGGAVCDAFGLKAFLPGSHMVGMQADASSIGVKIMVLLLLFL